MKEFAKRFIGKKCLITSFDGNVQYDGIIKEVTDGAILLEDNNKLKAINLDYILCIQDYAY